jgi:hypothetical protein
MPFNGSGVFTRAMNWVSDATAGIKIRADRHDSEDNNFASGLSQVICRDGQSVISADIPWNGKRITNLGDPVNAGDALNKQWAQANLISGAYVADTPPAVAQAGNLWWDSDSGNLFLKYSDGTSTQWVQVNVASPSAYASFLQRQVFSASGAITLHTETRAFLVQVQGSGGGGGGSAASGAATGGAGGGGGSGAYCETWIIKPAGVYNPACTVGSVTASAGNGQSSTFSDGTVTLTAGGGLAGLTGIATGNSVTISGGAGGAATGGMALPGEDGDWSVVNVWAGAASSRAGNGASSRFGAGGQGAGTASASSSFSNGIAARGYGAGGSGGYSMFGTGAVNGGQGGAGLVIITEFR